MVCVVPHFAPSSHPSVHVSHAGESHVGGGYSSAHGYVGHPSCGAGPGVRMVRDETDTFWTMYIPVMVHGRQTGTTTCTVANAEGEPLSAVESVTMLLLALIAGAFLYVSFRMATED
jgi:hypothetical protein